MGLELVPCRAFLHGCASFARWWLRPGVCPSPCERAGLWRQSGPRGQARLWRQYGADRGRLSRPSRIGLASFVGQGCAGLVEGVTQAALGPRELVVRFGDGAQCGPQGRGGAPLLLELVDQVGILAHRAHDGA